MVENLKSKTGQLGRSKSFNCWAKLTWDKICATDLLRYSNTYLFLGQIYFAIKNPNHAEKNSSQAKDAEYTTIASIAFVWRDKASLGLVPMAFSIIFLPHIFSIVHIIFFLGYSPQPKNIVL